MKMFWYSGLTLMTWSPLLISANRIGAERAPGDRPDPAEQRRAADDHRGDDLERQRRAARLRRGGAQPCRPEDAGQRRDAAADRVERDIHAGDADPVGRRGGAVAPDGADVVAEDRLLQDDVEHDPDDDGVEDEEGDAGKIAGTDGDEVIGEAVDIGPAGQDDRDAAREEEHPEGGDQRGHVQVDRDRGIDHARRHADADAAGMATGHGTPPVMSRPATTAPSA